MRFSFVAVVLASIVYGGCSNDPPPTESHPDSGADVGMDDSSTPPDTRVDSSSSDTTSTDTAASDSSPTDVGSDTSTTDAKVYPVIPVGYLVVEVNNGTSPATHARAEFVSDRAGGGCHGAYADPADLCIVTYCPDGAVTRVGSGDILYESQHTDGTHTDLTLTAASDGTYAPTTLGTAFWNDTDGFHWRVAGPGVPTLSYPFGGVGVVPTVSTVVSPTVASLSAGIDRSADLVVTLDKVQNWGPFIVRVRTAGATDATGTRLTCTFHDTSLTKTIPSVALSTLAAGSYTVTMSNEVGSGDAVPIFVGGSWQVFQYIDTVLVDGSGAAAQLTVDLK